MSMNFGNFCKRFGAAVGGLVLATVAVACAVISIGLTIPSAGSSLVFLSSAGGVAAAACECFYYAATGKWSAKDEAATESSSLLAQR